LCATVAENNRRATAGETHGVDPLGAFQRDVGVADGGDPDPFIDHPVAVVVDSVLDLRSSPVAHA